MAQFESFLGHALEDGPRDKKSYFDDLAQSTCVSNIVHACATRINLFLPPCVSLIQSPAVCVESSIPLSHITVWYHHLQPFFMQNPKAVRLAVNPICFFASCQMQTMCLAQFSKPVRLANVSKFCVTSSPSVAAISPFSSSDPAYPGILSSKRSLYAIGAPLM